MKIWYMNLKDNRGGGIPDASVAKFEYCMNESIVAIGWAKATEANEENYIQQNEKYYNSISSPKEFTHFLNMFHAFKSMEPGDIVMIYNREDKKYFLLQIADANIQIAAKRKLKDKEDIDLNGIDIGCYRGFGEKVCIGTYADIKKFFDAKRICKRQTIQQIRNPELQVAIRELFERMVAEGA